MLRADGYTGRNGYTALTDHLEASSLAKDINKTDFELDTAADDDSVDASFSADWKPSGISAYPTRSIFTKAVAFTENYGADAGRSGFMRFVLDYDIYAEGAGAFSDLSFDADVYREDGLGNILSSDAAFSWHINGDGEQKRYTGTWYSDWIPVTAMADFGSLHGSYSYRLVSRSEADLNAAELAAYPSGQARGYAKGTLSFEIAVAPVPEPETYALMATGLAGLAFARRTASRRQV